MDIAGRPDVTGVEEVTHIKFAPDAWTVGGAYRVFIKRNMTAEQHCALCRGITDNGDTLMFTVIANGVDCPMHISIDDYVAHNVVIQPLR